MTTPRPDEEATVRVDSDVRRPKSGSDAVQFAPGTIIAGRYRIAGILGSGGMGEVYRAEDTKLDQTVALKFLPARLARDPILLGRLHDEVRLGRQIAHPNVCRIYDIVDWESAHFVAMEFVDGEDLSRLLKRIGRISHDKAVEIARGIAAGLLAAHAKGILHRDLKPANVMIDSRGEARVMDFGLALVTGEHDGTISGTPAYMAPELFDAQPATVQSDLYALGLVMYELFTGKRVHNAHTLPERLRDLTSDITTPSSVVRDIDPAVERVILRCLHHDPAQRPGSAREVIQALPGGDPLAAAMAAGETPSPRIVAAAGTEGALRPAVAWTLLAAVAALMAALLALTNRGGFLSMTLARVPLEVQAARTGDLLRELGIPEQEFVIFGLEDKTRYTAWIFTHDTSPKAWERVKRGLPALSFWVREASEPFIDTRITANPRGDREAPRQLHPGSITAETDAKGRLVSLEAVASERWASRPLRWETLFAAAGLSAAVLTPANPRHLPDSYADARSAWTGKHPDDGTPIRIEAAAYRGIPVSFRIFAPWDEVDTRDQVPFGGTGFTIVITTFLLSAVVVGSLLAWRNLRQRRGDRTGAIRVGATVFFAVLLSDMLVANHALDIAHELSIVYFAISQGLTWGAALALVYLALEPYVRRRWPDRLISWARLLTGRWRDPMVGRDLLIGITGGLAHSALASADMFFRELFTGIPDTPSAGEARLLGSAPYGVAVIPQAVTQGILLGLSMMIALMLFTMVLRKRALGVAALFAMYLSIMLTATQELWMLPALVLAAALYTLLVARFGLLTMAAAHMTFVAIFFYPLPDAVAWYTMRGLTTVFFIVALAVWAFRTSLGGQRAFSAIKLDDG
jgi:hypothetical protein